MSVLTTTLLALILGQASAPAEIIYVNAKVVTVDARFSVGSAFAVSGDRILAVGGDITVRKFASADTRVVDLKGHTVLPGFIDSHAHTVDRRLPGAQSLSLSGADSVAEIIKRVAAAAEKSQRGAWVVTSPIGESPDYFDLPESLLEKRWPTRQELDSAAPHHPVYIPTSNKYPYPAFFNSAALTLLGVDSPTGAIEGLHVFNREDALYRKVLSLLPPLPEPLRQAAIARAMQENVAVGVTSIYESHRVQPNLVSSLRALQAAGKLPNRVVVAPEVPATRSLADIDAWMAQQVDAAGAGAGDDRIKTLGVTISIDGPSQFGDAWMSEPYLSPAGQMANGTPVVSLEKLTDIARLAIKRRLRLNVLAAGDRAGAMTLSALEAVNRETPIRDRRWVVQHFQHPSRDEIARLRDLGVVAATYSNVDFSKGAETYIRRFPGSDLWKRVVPLRWWIDGGVTVAQSSDGAHYAPAFTLWESLVRVDGRTGRSLLTPEKTITREEAIRLYTINGARVMQWEDRLGSIEVGKLADFVVLDRDILTVPVNSIRDTKVLLTVVGGKTVYGEI